MKPMRRFNQSLLKKECLHLLENTTSGVLAVQSKDYPYAVPLSYVYDDNKLYFHCANEGHKLEAIKRDPKVSFCIISQDDIIAEKFTTFYKSVIVFGTASIIEDINHKRKALELLCNKYSPNMPEATELEINSAIDKVCIIMIDIEEMTGKQAKELTRK